MTKPYSQACENNKKAILDKLKPLLTQLKNVLEVGSGTGQHAVHFAQAMPHLTWQTSDLAINHAGINQWIADATLTNVVAPIAIDFNHPWPIDDTDAIYTANTLHIVSFALVQRFFSAAGKHLSQHGLLCVYGPFNYGGQFTSPSNANFQLWLKDNDARSGIRDFEAIEQLASAANLSLIHDHEMPANNRLLVFVKN
jgi:cyclopropane fatty-acyl-phospholipid synthase-like methyltransferase